VIDICRMFFAVTLANIDAEVHAERGARRSTEEVLVLVLVVHPVLRGVNQLQVDTLTLPVDHDSSVLRQIHGGVLIGALINQKDAVPAAAA
jgi:hypothetical protein